jgi:hypothetical protein
VTNEQWRRAQPVLTLALGLDPAERDRLLQSAFEREHDLGAEIARVLRELEAASLRQGLSTTRTASVGPGFMAATFGPETRDRAPFLSPGDMCGHYRIVRFLGSGGMGQVYVAEDVKLGTPAALKFVADDLLESPDARARLQREAARAAQLRFHPHIATVLEFMEIDVKGRAVAVLAMEYVQGTPASELLHAGPIKAHDAIQWGIQVTHAIEFAHEKGILHCDLKPANLHVERTSAGDHLKVLDFGIAKALYGGRFDDGFGTLPYMSPEQLVSGDCDTRTDIYALGVTVFELVAGRRPFHPEDRRELIAHIIGAPIPNASAFVSGLPRDLDAVLQRAMAKQPDQRFASMAEFRNALEKLIRVASPRRVPRAAALVAFVTVLAFITFVGFVTSQAFDQGVGLTAEVRPGTLWLWFVWGIRSLIAPLLFSVILLLAAISMGSAARLMARAARHRSRKLRSTIERIASLGPRVASLPTGTTGPVLLLVHIGILLVLAVTFRSLLESFMNFMMASRGSIDALRPSNQADHELFGYMVTTELLVFCVAWYALLRVRSSRHEREGAVYVAAGLAAAGLSMFLFSARFRILSHNERERVVYGVETCYLIEERGPQALLFCPLAYPRNVVANISSFQRTGLIESIFAPLDTRQGG